MVARSPRGARRQARRASKCSCQLLASDRSMKILCADDDKDLLALIAFTLSQAGYLVLRAGDGTSAIRSFAAEAPDLVLLDINMPGASGFQVCEAIRAQSRVPVMMLTVRGEEED